MRPRWQPVTSSKGLLDPPRAPCSKLERWHNSRDRTFPGGVAERLIAPVLKTGRPKGLVSSNLTPSARSMFDVRCSMFDVRSAAAERARLVPQKEFRGSQRIKHRTNNAPRYRCVKNQSGSGEADRQRQPAGLRKTKR